MEQGSYIFIQFQKKKCDHSCFIIKLKLNRPANPYWLPVNYSPIMPQSTWDSPLGRGCGWTRHLPHSQWRARGRAWSTCQDKSLSLQYAIRRRSCVDISAQCSWPGPIGNSASISLQQYSLRFCQHIICHKCPVNNDSAPRCLHHLGWHRLTWH